MVGIVGDVTTLAGFAGSLGTADGDEQTARFAYPFGVAADLNRNVYVSDSNSHTIRKVTQAGTVTTFAGLAEVPGSTDGAGNVARFNQPRAMAVDGAGLVYVADANNHTIRVITPAGVVTTLAGLAGSTGSTDATGNAARFNAPGGIAADGTGTVYVADTNNHTIRKIAPGGIVTTLAGLAGSSGSADGTGSAARFNMPRAVAVDAAGVVYVADSSNRTIRRITPLGVVTTVAGLAGSGGFSDGIGSAARFSGPQGIAVDSTGTLYVADSSAHTIRRVTAGNVVTTIAGCPGCIGAENYGRFNQPQSVAVDSRGFIYVADSANNTIRTTAPVPMSLVADFGAYGIWQRIGTTWRQVHPYAAKALLKIKDGNRDLLVIDFGPGVGVWDWGRESDGSEFWFQLHSSSPRAMVGIDRDGDAQVEAGVFDFTGYGLWLYDGDQNQWSPLHALSSSHLAAADLDGVAGEELIVDFPGYGLWVYNGAGWSSLHPSDVSSIVTADLDGNGRRDLVLDFPGFGVWGYMNGTTWMFIHPLEAKRMADADLDGNGVSDLAVDFGAGLGVWILRNGTTWAFLHASTTENVVSGDLDGNGRDEVIVDFGAAGLWSYEDGRGWEFVHATSPGAMATGRLR
jgi:sugar lactone lactonase YvrE